MTTQEDRDIFQDALTAMLAIFGMCTICERDTLFDGMSETECHFFENSHV